MFLKSSAFFLFLSILVLSVSSEQEVGIPPALHHEAFINNGPEARIEDFPYVVSVRRNAIHIGGGAIVSPNWVITAAHILLGCPPSQMTIRAGSQERVLGGFLHNAREVQIHGSFDPHNLEYNIALIGVLEPFLFSETLRAVPLDIQGTIVIPGTVAHVPGFGIIMPANQNLSPVLRFTTLAVQPVDACQNSLERFLDVTGNMLCTSSTAHNPCHGDFGGPLVTNQGVLIGIASWNAFCSNAGYSTVFTRIAAIPVRAFIRGVIGF